MLGGNLGSLLYGDVSVILLPITDSSRGSCNDVHLVLTRVVRSIGGVLQVPGYL